MFLFSDKRLRNSGPAPQRPGAWVANNAWVLGSTCPTHLSYTPTHNHANSKPLHSCTTCNTCCCSGLNTLGSSIFQPSSVRRTHVVTLSNGPGIGDWHSAAWQASAMADRKASSSMLADTPRALMRNDPPAQGVLSSDDGRDAINCNSSVARAAGSRFLMAFPSTVTSNKYAVSHGMFTMVWQDRKWSWPGRDGVPGFVLNFSPRIHSKGTPGNNRDPSDRTFSHPRFR